MYLKSMIPVLLFLLLGWPFTQVAAGKDRPRLVGEVAYSEPMLFDYDRDGHASQVQFWLALDIKPALGNKGEPGYKPEEGTVRRYLKDIEKGTPVIGYNQFMMVPDNPLGEPVHVSDIQISGNTVVFSIENSRITVTDNGPGFANDSISVNDGIRDYPVTLYDGDLNIIHTKQ